MEFNLHTIILTIVTLLVLYLVYMYFFSNSATTLVKMQDARGQSTVSPSSLQSGTTSDYTFSIWFYINDWNYRIGQDKVIFERRATSENKACPSVSLGANTNNLTVTIETYTKSGETKASTCVITDVPIQRWTNFIMSVNGRALDLYIDGKLVKTCILEGPPKTFNNTPINICPNGGFSGYVSTFQYVAKSINPSEAYNMYKQGYGGSSSLTGMFNKYRFKVSFMEDNRQVNSFEL